MADTWVGAVNTTAPAYLKGASDLTKRERILLAMLEQRGRMIFNENGNECIWTVQMREPPVEQLVEGSVINYTRHDLYKQLTTDWRGYRATDQMTDMEKEKNKGRVAIIDRYKRILPNLMKSLRHRFCAELYIDGNASGNENAIHGIESFMGAGTTVAADRLVKPDDTYGGLSTALGNEGGSWSTGLTTKPNANVATDWPDGQGDTEYDYLSPKILNWSSSSWDGGNTDWQSNCIQVLRQAQMWLQGTGGKEGQVDLCLLARDLMYGFKNAFQPYLQIAVPHKEAHDLGFPDVLNFEGMAVKSEFDVPVGKGYFINADGVELASLKDDLFYSRGPTYDPRTDSYLFLAGAMANLRWQPKLHGKTYAAA
jgi:hypothetical protein